MERKTVLVTGSSSGIGASTIIKYASNNYNVIITYANNIEEAEKLNNEIKKYNVDSLIIKCDISKENDIDNLYNEIKNKFNTIDVLVNNAGICKDDLFENKNKNDFMKILEVNLVGTFLVSKKISQIINNNGSIINIASTNGIDSYYEYSLDYDASKAGVINLTHNLANHYSPNIRVNCICPGWVDTPMNKDLDKEDYLKSILLNRFASPEEIANVIYFLSSDEASYINDSIIKVDGGVRHE